MTAPNCGDFVQLRFTNGRCLAVTIRSKSIAPNIDNGVTYCGGDSSDGTTYVLWYYLDGTVEAWCGGKQVGKTEAPQLVLN